MDGKRASRWQLRQIGRSLSDGAKLLAPLQRLRGTTSPIASSVSNTWQRVFSRRVEKTLTPRPRRPDDEVRTVQRAHHSSSL